jgi:hypothetical protein
MAINGFSVKSKFASVMPIPLLIIPNNEPEEYGD